MKFLYVVFVGAMVGYAAGMLVDAACKGVIIQPEHFTCTQSQIIVGKAECVEYRRAEK